MNTRLPLTIIIELIKELIVAVHDRLHHLLPLDVWVFLAVVIQCPLEGFGGDHVKGFKRAVEGFGTAR